MEYEHSSAFVRITGRDWDINENEKDSLISAPIGECAKRNPSPEEKQEGTSEIFQRKTSKLRPKVTSVKFPGIVKGIGEAPDVRECEDLQKLNEQNQTSDEIGLQACVWKGEGFQQMSLKRKLVQNGLICFDICILLPFTYFACSGIYVVNFVI